MSETAKWYDKTITTNPLSRDVIQYKTIGGSKWLAKRVGNQFLHAPDGNWSKAFKSEYIDYVEDGERRFAKIERDSFNITPNNDPSKSYQSTALYYQDWQGQEHRAIHKPYYVLSGWRGANSKFGGSNGGRDVVWGNQHNNGIRAYGGDLTLIGREGDDELSGNSTPGDREMQYVNWDGTLWTAQRWDTRNGKRFYLTPNGGGSKSHFSDHINYRLGDDKWSAKLDGDTFIHAKEGRWSGAHRESYINYNTWEGIQQTAKVEGNVFLAPSGNQPVSGYVFDGGAGNDTINGSAGDDVMRGGSGADIFSFNTPQDGVDTIRDFYGWQGDVIEVSSSGFGIQPHDVSQFSFNSNTGALAFQGKQFASLQKGTDFNLSQDLDVLDSSRNKLRFNDLAFSTEGQSIWNSGDSFTFRDNRFLGTQWNESNSQTISEERVLVPEVSIPNPFGKDIVITPEVKMPKVSVSGSTSGEVGLQSDFQIQGGTVNASLPIDLWLDVPDKVKAGESVTIKSGFSLDETASFSTLSPNVSYDLDLIFGMKANEKIKMGNSEKTLVPDVNISKQQVDFLNLDGKTTNLRIPEGTLGGWGSLNLSVPDLDTKGSVIGANKLAATASDRFLEATLDLDKIATTLFQTAGIPIPNLQDSISTPKLGGLEVSAAYNIADFELAPDLTLKQSVNLETESLKGTLKLENGDDLDFVVGEDITFIVPEGVGESLDIQAEVNLDANLGNTTTLGYDVDFDFKALSGSLGLKYKGIGVPGKFPLNPLYQKSFDLFNGDIADVYNQSFDLGGFNSQSFNFDVAIA